MNHGDYNDMMTSLREARAEVGRLTETLSAAEKERDALGEALLSAEKERDTLRATLARLQTPASDLPPIGTRWGDIPAEVRARLPVGTVLGPPVEFPHLSTVALFPVDYDCGSLRPDRRILSYPPAENP